ncbi:hypothetical protein COCMIDRAFT_25889 [Bipolaris oryzae ATCC 44560]|uniref:Secreted protein n=1 Tax=Bipolaris oryzae ATCC 44560 TaxID=930090 RepID=W6Z896_COCMI|nr:uncharacterized protein COCMIDRAFT_25889 [Bipolaris oryzae ATCC 44560]EUC46013.1 hypothetical protein COCMIDRAFT_25889 [Bipolaris oryzae ATCC 44560]
MHPSALVFLFSGSLFLSLLFDQYPCRTSDERVYFTGLLPSGTYANPFAWIGPLRRNEKFRTFVSFIPQKPQESRAQSKENRVKEKEERKQNLVKPALNTDRPYSN